MSISLRLLRAEADAMRETPFTLTPRQAARERFILDTAENLLAPWAG